MGFHSFNFEKQNSTNNAPNFSVAESGSEMKQYNKPVSLKIGTNNFLSLFLPKKYCCLYETGIIILPARRKKSVSKLSTLACTQESFQLSYRREAQQNGKSKKKSKSLPYKFTIQKKCSGSKSLQ